ncbi:MAG: tetratricopeptide repeat protein, partial [Anaerolineaceae bacterium]|nr:tetratricopeptide repeat protein [Anaerolineaceae bacterium]
MDTQVVIDQPNNKTRKAAAKTCLNNNELAEAVRIYAELLRDDPQDIDSLITLGNLYLAVGDGKSARSLYKQAQDKEPNNRVVQCQLQLTSSEACQGNPDIPASHPAAISNLIRQLTGVQQENEDQELSRAAKMLDNIIRSDNPAEQVADHIEEIDRLLPALVEINIRQAWADGRPELVESLQMVKQSILSQINMEETKTAEPTAAAPRSSRGNLPRMNARVLILKDANGGLSERMNLVEASLGTLGCEVYAHTEYNPIKDPLPDVAIVNNPHVSAKVLESLAALSASQIPIIVDLDNNFEQMPVSHPSYATAGLGTLTRYKAFNTAMILADMVTVNSEALASSLSSKEYNVRTIPDGWISENHFWHDSNGQHNTINLGWISKTGQLEDLALIRRVVTRIIREFSNTQILIIGDSQAYRLFETIPENRRNYL